MWKKILKIDMGEARRLGDTYSSDDMEGFDVERRKHIQYANKLDKYVKENIYGLMDKPDREFYDFSIDMYKKEAQRDADEANKFKQSLMTYLSKFNLPRRL